MDFPSDVINKLKDSKVDNKPVVFIRAFKGVQPLIPNSDLGTLLKEYLTKPETASSKARRTYRQAVVLRTINNKARHYPLWTLFSCKDVQLTMSNKNNQIPPKLSWVHYKRKVVRDFLGLTKTCPKLETIDSKVHD